MKNQITITAPRLPGDGAILERLSDHARQAEGAYSEATLRAYRYDSGVWAAWCSERGFASIPATPAMVAAFVDHQAAGRRRAPATVRRILVTVARMHRIAGLETPTRAEAVRLALRRMDRSNGTSQRQALGLTWPLRQRLIAATGGDLRGLRDRALLALGYDGLLRRSELVALEVADIREGADGGAAVRVARSKTDQTGEGAFVYAAPDTVGFLRDWLLAARIAEGAVFRAVHGARTGKRLGSNRVARVFRAMAAASGLSLETVREISGHSTRVGGAQDMVAAGIDLSAAMQAGRWKSVAMLTRYTRHLSPERGGMAKLAKMQGRAGQ